MERREALQQAIDEIARQRAEITRLRAAAREPIAVVGMACRFPGAANTDEYWDLLSRGGDAVTDVPPERWNAAAFYDADAAAVGKMMTRQGAFIRGADQFDPQFFGIAPREAQNMDPQQRLLLEVTWEALENANIAPSDLYGSATGVFVGITCFDHAIRISQAAENFNAYAGTGSALNMAPGRVSYVLGLTGPSMAVDTACSSSLVCLHLACQSLRERETNAAIVGGVHLILSPHVMVSFSQARMLAADGRSKTFDASADGYSRGEGCGVVVLKRLADAVAHRDTILGVIRGTAVNQDGPSGGLTVPNGASQQKVIRQALRAADVAPPSVSYVEAHGTGTPLGDPIEVEALANVYGEERSPERPLLIGSVKTNIGHLEPAAGMAGLIKILLSFRHGVLPRHLHFHTPNPHIPWSELPVKVASEPTAWPRGDQPRMAGLSAFGFSGTNAHVIVEEPPDEPTAAAFPRRLQLIPLSAKSASALRLTASRYREWLSRRPAEDIAAVAYTASIGRTHFPFRLALLAETTGEAIAALEAFIANRSTPAARTAKTAGADYRRDVKEVKARLADAYERRDMAEVAALYLEGVEIDWPRLYADGIPPRVTLPGYPFERQRFWIDTTDQQVAPTAGGAATYQLVWKSAGPAAADVASCYGRRWTIVGEDPGLTANLVSVLTASGATASVASVAEVVPAPSTSIIFVGAPRDPGAATESCSTLLDLVQRVASSGAASRLWVVTRGAVPVAGEMTVAAAAAAPLAAFARVVGLEHPEFFGRLIDLDPVSASNDATSLLAEILCDDAEDQVALRKGERFVQRVDRLPDAQTLPLQLRTDATYLVTGGLGRIGLICANDLVRRGAREVCLVSRRGITSDEQRASVAEMERSGAAVRVAAVDVADRAAMAALIRDISADKPIAGVIHAAGVPGYTEIAQLTAETLSEVLRPKVQGAWNLHDLTRRLKLDFFVCFSSISSAWGSRGQAHYAAANAFLDALAYLRRAESLPAVTINWGPWVDGGMTSPEAESLLRRVGVRPLPTAAALTALSSLMQGRMPQVVVADIDWVLFKGSYEARGHRPLLERLAVTDDVTGAAADNALLRQLALTPPAGRERLLADAIQREAAEVLELSAPAQADLDQGLFEMGMDSLMALELRTRLQTLVCRALPATLVFDCPTIRAMARFLLRELEDRPDAAAPAATATTAAVTPDGLDDLTEAEAEALLLKKLDTIR